MIAFDRLRDGGVVHNRHELSDMPRKQFVEQGPIGVEDFHEEQSSLKTRRFFAVLFICLVHLLIQGLNRFRQHALQTEFLPFFVGEPGSFVDEGVVQYCESAHVVSFRKSKKNSQKAIA
jgi:hypothetical protein